jgi:hypothetical protein
LVFQNKLPSTGGYGSDRQQPTYDVGGYKQTDYETGGFKQQEQDKGGQSKSPKKKEGHGATGNEDEDKKEGDGKKGGAGTSRSRRFVKKYKPKKFNLIKTINLNNFEKLIQK